MNATQRWWKRRKHQLWLELGRSVYGLQLFKLAPRYIQQGIGVVEKNTDIVIEGFPRSANTFAFAALQLSQKQPLKIAHHIHGIAQVKLGVQYNLPVVLLIRKPVEAVCSLLIRKPAINPALAFADYTRFYQELEAWSEHVIIAPFSLVIHDFGRVIEQINLRFDTCFSSFEHTQANMQAVYKLVEQMDERQGNQKEDSELRVARPSEQRAHLKTVLLKSLLSTKYDRLRMEANEVYERYMDKAYYFEH